MIKDFDWGKLDAILQFYPTKKMCADILEVSEDTIDRRIKEAHGLSFMEYRDRKMGKVKLKMQQKIIEMALSGNVASLIFCLKNCCGWTDRQEHSISQESTQMIRLAYNLDDDN